MENKPRRLPPNVVADILNSKNISQSRSKIYKDDYVLHVSELINMSPSNMFCPREFVLAYTSSTKDRVISTVPGLQLLFALGNAIHDHVRNIWIKHSPLGRYAYGKWTCLCGDTVREGAAIRIPRICPKCKTPCNNYDEISLRLPKYNTVGHPDFIIRYDGVYHLYEIKGIERKDIDFDAMKAPLGDHTLQASFYYWMMKSSGYKVSKNIRYVYADRDVKKMFGGTVYKEFIQKASPIERILPFLRKSLIIKKCLKADRLPSRICENHRCTRAKNCSRVTECFSTDRKEL